MNDESEQPAGKDKTWFIATTVTGLLSGLGASAYAVAAKLFLVFKYRPLADAYRLNESNSEGCLVGLTGFAMYGAGYLLGGVTTVLALISIGLAIKARSPWAAAFAVAANVALWIVVRSFGL